MRLVLVASALLMMTCAHGRDRGLAHRQATPRGDFVDGPPSAQRPGNAIPQNEPPVVTPPVP